MSARTALFTTLVAFTALVALLFGNAISGIAVVPSKHLSPNAVRGMAIEHQGVLYTLNFEQQNELVQVFNRATALAPETPKASLEAPPVKQVVVYRFNAPDMHIGLLGFLDGGQENKLLAFSNPEWSTEPLGSPVTETFLSMLSNTYDP